MLPKKSYWCINYRKWRIEFTIYHFRNVQEQLNSDMKTLSIQTMRLQPSNTINACLNVCKGWANIRKSLDQKNELVSWLQATMRILWDLRSKGTYIASTFWYKNGNLFADIEFTYYSIWFQLKFQNGWAGHQRRRTFDLLWSITRNVWQLNVSLR